LRGDQKGRTRAKDYVHGSIKPWMRREEPTLSLCVIRSWHQDQGSSWAEMVVSVVSTPMEAPLTLVVVLVNDLDWFII
jgi:hypothetical protein